MRTTHFSNFLNKIFLLLIYYLTQEPLKKAIILKMVTVNIYIISLLNE